VVDPMRSFSMIFLQATTLFLRTSGYSMWYRKETSEILSLFCFFHAFCTLDQCLQFNSSPHWPFCCQYWRPAPPLDVAIHSNNPRIQLLTSIPPHGCPK
jgi:hypothetical protein